MNFLFLIKMVMGVETIKATPIAVPIVQTAVIKGALSMKLRKGVIVSISPSLKISEVLISPSPKEDPMIMKMKIIVL